MIIIGANGGVITQELQADKPDRQTYAPPIQETEPEQDAQNHQQELPRKRKSKPTKAYIWLGAVFFFGMLYGAFLINKYDQQMLNALSFITKHFVESRAHQQLYVTFLNSAFSGLLLLAGMYLSGFSVIGAPISVGLLAFEGLGLGVSLSYLYLYHKTQGVLYSLAIIIPGALVLFFALLVACYESVSMSGYFLKYLSRREVNQKHNMFWRYTMKYVVFVIVVLICAVIDCTVTFFLAGYFKL